MGKRNNTNNKSGISENKLITIFKVTIIVVTFIFYYNTIFNHFSMDDYHINMDNPQSVKGIAGIPEIFSTLYADESGMTYGYRPMVRTSFALEYQFTGNMDSNPYISHFISILLYTLAMLLLYKVLRRLLRGYNIWFPFLITLLFMAHPTHTEAVASLKNRDIILNFIFSFTAIWQFIRWADTDKIKHFIFGLISFVLALLSKETAVAQLAVFPLVLYFFTTIRPKKIGLLAIAGVTIIAILVIAQKLFLPDISREFKLWESPLPFIDNYWLHLSTGLYGLGYYLKLIFIPYPLHYYYGYDMIPVVGWDNIWVLLSFVAYMAMLVYAITRFKSKSLLSFTILYFFVNMSMYANFVTPVPGIVGDRFVFFSTLSMSIFVIWLLFKIFGMPLLKSEKNKKRIIWVNIVTLIIIIPFGYYVHIRNAQWRTHSTLYSSDMPGLWNSSKANGLYAHELMKKVNVELSKPVNPYKFILGMINKAEKHYKRSVELDSSRFATWSNLGIIYSKIHGNQAKLRMQSHLKYNKPEKAEEERINSINYFNKATGYFKKAIELNPDYGSAYFNLAHSYDLQNKFDSSIVYFKKAIVADNGELVSMSRLANAYYLNNQPMKAIEQNQKIIKAFPHDDMPYINLGNYALQSGDTINAITSYKKAFELGSNANVGKLLTDYYKSIGDKKTSDYYFRRSYDAEKLNNK